MPVVEHLIFVTLGEKERESAMIGVECEVICVEPGTELLKSEDDGKKFTSCSWIGALSWVECGAGERDVIKPIIN